MDLGTIFLLLIAVLMAMLVISVLAKKQVSLVTSLSPQRAAEVVNRKFSGLAWKRVDGRGALNYRARGIAIGGRTPPVMSIDIVTDEDTGFTLVDFWMSEWTSQLGMVNHVEKVFWKRWSIPKALRDAEEAGGPVGSPASARSNPAALVDRHGGHSPLAIDPPDLDRIEFLYEESRRYEDQSSIRSDKPPASIWSIPKRLGVLGSSGQPILPWYATNVAGAVASPAGRAIALIVEGVDPLQIRTVDGPEIPVSSIPDARIMQNRGFSTCGMSWSPDGRRIACLEWNGVGTLTLLDADTGARTFLTTLKGVVGNEVPVFSPDGRWILVSINAAPQLISLEDRTVVELPLKSAYLDWWPAKGPSALFALTGASDQQRCGLYDLATATLIDLGPLILPVQDDLPEGRRIVFGPRVSPDGSRVLVGTFFGPDARYQDEQGSRERVAILDISTRIVTTQTEPFVDPGRWLERVHRRWSWVSKPGTSAPTSGPTQVADELRFNALPFDNVDPAKVEPADERVVVWPMAEAAGPTPPSNSRPTVPLIAAPSTPQPVGPVGGEGSSVQMSEYLGVPARTPSTRAGIYGDFGIPDPGEVLVRVVGEVAGDQAAAAVAAEVAKVRRSNGSIVAGDMSAMPGVKGLGGLLSYEEIALLAWSELGFGMSTKRSASREIKNIWRNQGLDPAVTWVLANAKHRPSLDLLAESLRRNAANPMGDLEGAFRRNLAKDLRHGSGRRGNGFRGVSSQHETVVRDHRRPHTPEGTGAIGVLSAGRLQGAQRLSRGVIGGSAAVAMSVIALLILSKHGDRSSTTSSPAGTRIAAERPPVAEEENAWQSQGNGGVSSTPPTGPRSSVAAAESAEVPPINDPDLGLDVPLSRPACDGTGIVILGSAYTPGKYREQIQRLLSLNPGSSYLRTDLTCPSLRQSVDGNPVYAAYRVAGSTTQEVCDALATVPSGPGTYGKWLNSDPNPDNRIQCG